MQFIHSLARSRVTNGRDERMELGFARENGERRR